MQRAKPKLVLIGWREADWPFLQPLLEAGVLPNLAQIVKSGVAATLSAPDPLVEPALWTSLATGLRSDRHGVNHTTEIRPDLGGVQPTGRRSWAVPAFWEWAQAAGLQTTCINWPATSPAARWPGMHVDELFKVATGTEAALWPVPRHAVSPISIKPALRHRRVHPAEDLVPHLSALLPPEGVLDALLPMSDNMTRRLLAAVLTVHETSLALAERTNWDVLCLCTDILVLRRAGSDASTADRQAVSQAAAILADLMLGQLLSFVPRQAGVFVVSPAGMATAGNTPPGRRLDGVLAGTGPNTRLSAPHEPRPVISLLDVAPSLLARLGIRYDCDGKINAALAVPSDLAAVETPAPPWALPSLAPAPTGLRRVTSERQENAMRRSGAAARLNKARALVGRGCLAEAAQLFAEADCLWPNNPPILKGFVQCLLRLNRYDQALQIAHALASLDPHDREGQAMLAMCRTRRHAPA